MKQPAKKRNHNIIESLLPLAVTIDKVKLDPRNARLHPESNMAAIQQSLKAYGQRKPIVVNARTGAIEAGNGLFQAAVKLGWTHIAVVMVTDDEDTAKGYAIMDNKSALLAEWDFPVLKDLLQELDTGAFDMDLTGFNQGEIEDLMTQFQVIEPGKTDDDAIPKEVETICKTGDLWQLGNHRLLCGDATRAEDVERLMDGKKADMVFTDPPYGINKEGIPNDENLSAYYSAIDISFGFTGKDIYLCTFGWVNLIGEMISKTPKYRFLWVCINHTPNTGPHGIPTALGFNEWSPIMVFLKGKPKPREQIRDYFKNTDQSEVSSLSHPTPKNVQVCVYFIGRLSYGNEVILDSFGGSGSTLIACEKLNRHCFMLEIVPHYCDVIIRRWEDFMGRKGVKL